MGRSQHSLNRHLVELVRGEAEAGDGVKTRARPAEPPAFLSSRGVAYALRVVVFGAPGPLWRVLHVRGEMSLRCLNRVIRRALGWQDDHQYVLGVRRPWDGERVALVERRVRVCDVAGPGDLLEFGYEYGRGWQVDALVCGLSGGQGRYPVCVSGSGECEEWPADAQAYWDLRCALGHADDARHVRAYRLWRGGLESESGPRLTLRDVNADLRRGRYPLLEEGTAPRAVRRGRRRRSRVGEGILLRPLVAEVPRHLIQAEDLRGEPGLSRAAQAALLAAQPSTVSEALRIRGVGRRTTKHLLELGRVTDAEGVQGGLRRADFWAC